MVNKDMKDDHIVEKMMKVENKKWSPKIREVGDPKDGEREKRDLIRVE